MFFKTKKEALARKLTDYNKLIIMSFYEGIDGLTQNTVCEIALVGINIVINPLSGQKTKITLPIERIISMDMLFERDFLKRYKGTSHVELNRKNIPEKQYLLMNYRSLEGEKSLLVFWSAGKMKEIQEFCKIPISDMEVEINL